MKEWIFTLTLILFFSLSVSGCQPKIEPEKNAVESAEFFKDINSLPAPDDQSESQSPQASPSAGAAQEQPLTMAPEKPSIQDIQMSLKNADLYQGKVDGILGPRTRKAIEAFQEQNGLKVDGKVGPKTWASLKGHFSSPAEQASTSTAATTIASQESSSGGIKD